MSVDRHLFWVLQDQEINNEELFFPPDTPIGSINLTKSKKKIEKRHERQLKRLAEQQLQELRRFQKKFSERYDHQVYLDSAPPACEFINGMDFLKQFGADLASLALTEVGSSQEYRNNNKQSVDMKRRDSKNMIEARKLDYSVAFRRRFKSGFESIENNHKQQFERLKSIQSDELSKWNDSTSNKSIKEKEEKEAVEVSMKIVRNVERDKEKKEHVNERKQMHQRPQRQHLRHKEQNEQQQQLLPPPPPPQKQNIQGEPKKKRNVRARGKLPDNFWPSSPPHSPHSPPQVQPKTPNQVEPGQDKKRYKFGKVINTSHREPPAVISSLHNRQSSSQGVPMITVPKYLSNYKTSKIVGNVERPIAPLFHSAKAKNSSKSIVLMDTGAITVKSKPNRVVIRSQNLGDPKDYDDAINGYKRKTENPVTKRYYYGKPHLFYKNASGEIVNVGPVEKIKPLITTFLLSS